MAEKDVNEYGLNDKQIAFCEYYMKNNCATTSYQKAYDPDGSRGIGKASCGSNGSRLLKKDRVQNYLNHLRSQISNERKKTAEDVISRLEEIAYGGASKESNEVRALELLGKYYALWNDKLTLSDDLQIEINLSAELEQEDTGEIVEQNVEKIEEKKASNE